MKQANDYQTIPDKQTSNPSLQTNGSGQLHKPPVLQKSAIQPPQTAVGHKRAKSQIFTGPNG